MEEILINVESKEIRSASLRNGVLFDLVIERKKERQLTGNIYLGKVRNILHNIQSAFIDINEEENGFIHISDILENSKKFEQLYDLDVDTEDDLSGESSVEESEKEEEKEEESLEGKDIDQLLMPDQTVLVQVVKEPIGQKGARLTSNISIAGRYLVFLPNSPHRGVSRKIEGRKDRERLKRLIRALKIPKKMGIICRTACRTATDETIIEEAEELLKTWEHILDQFNNAKEPKLLFEESDLIKRSILTALDKGYDRVLIDNYDTYQSCKKLIDRYGGDKGPRLEFYRDKTPMFERFNVEREIEKTMRRKIWMQNGGYLYFDRTEAMYTIDINSGRSGTGAATVEESLVRINLEAAEEIARQLRLRNIGGLVIIDFIDMRLRKNQRRVLEKLKECMSEDSAKCTILGMSEFGLVEMTRQRHRGSLEQTMFTECPYCYGRGFIKSYESVSIEIERALNSVIRQHQQYALKLVVHPEIDHHLSAIDKEFLFEIAEKQNAQLVLETNPNLHLNDFEFYSTTSNLKIEV